MDQSRSTAREAVRAAVSEEYYNADAGEAVLRGVIVGVLQTHGTAGLADLAYELASKLAETVAQIASSQGLPAVDVVDIVFIDPPA